MKHGKKSKEAPPLLSPQLTVKEAGDIAQATMLIDWETDIHAIHAGLSSLRSHVGKLGKAKPIKALVALTQIRDIEASLKYVERIFSEEAEAGGK